MDTEQSIYTSESLTINADTHDRRRRKPTLSSCVFVQHIWRTAEARQRNLDRQHVTSHVRFPHRLVWSIRLSPSLQYDNVIVFRIDSLTKEDFKIFKSQCKRS